MAKSPQGSLQVERRVLIASVAEPDQTPVVVAPPTAAEVSWDWGLTFGAVGAIVGVAGLLVGWVGGLLGRQFNALDRDLVNLVERNRERFDKQDLKFGKLFDLIRELDTKFVSRAEFDGEMQRVRAELAQLREQESAWVSRLESQLQELSDRTERHFDAIRKDLRGRG